MKQREAIIKVMESNGGYATYQYIYDKALKLQDVEWKAKDPRASIRGYVQKNKEFFQVKPGLWALESWRNNLPNDIKQLINENESNLINKDYTHAYFQGVLLEIGKFCNYKTYVHCKDKNQPYLGRKLIDIATTDRLPSFTYDSIINKIKTIDVMWLNSRDFPVHVFEVENTTDFKNSLIKFNELKEFNIQMSVVAPKERRERFRDIVCLDVFKEIKDRTDFIDYQKVDGYCSGLRNIDKFKF